MCTRCRVTVAIGALALAMSAGLSIAAELPRLKVSENHHFLVTADGEPFFYLGDTAWELFHRLSLEEADAYLTRRKEQGFTVIQAVALAEFDGLTVPNANGHVPLVENDPARPDVKDGPNNDYWDHVDAIVDLANSKGLYVGFLPTWGDKWNKKWGVGPEIFTPENAATYGEWLGRRYQDKGLIWILGGDRPIETDAHRAITEALAQALKKGDGGAHLMTYHPMGGRGSSDWFADADWLDFHFRQNGHNAEFGSYQGTRADYDRQPPKPVIDGEPIYEGHPVSFKANDLGHSIAADCRRALYWDLFTGACGHTYGHHSMWQFFAEGRQPVNSPLLPWRDAINDPGANQMQYGRRLIESRPVLTRIPDDSVIVPANPETSVPGRGIRRFVATRDEAGRYAFVYAPIGRSFTVKLSAITGPKVVAWWFNPRNGESQRIGEFSSTEDRAFQPPDPGEFLDWVLVLDDASRGYPPPGSKPSP